MTTAPAHTHTHVRALADRSEARDGRDARRRDGAFYTDDDVAVHLARRAIGAWLLDRLDTPHLLVDDLLSSGADLVAEVRARARVSTAQQTHVVDALRTLVVLDPTCGAGSFLAAAWAVLAELDAALDAGVVSPSQLHGIDVDAGAIAACRAVLAHVTGDVGDGPTLTVGDAEARGTLVAADIVLGNPPFVRASADARHEDLTTCAVPNRSAWIVERSLDAARPGARIAFVLPISTACTDAFAPARASWDRACDVVHAAHFDTIPSSLFRGVVQRISILEGRRSGQPGTTAARWFTTRYHRWRRDERDALLDSIRYVPMPPQTVAGSLAKIGTSLEAALLATVFAHPPAGRLFAGGAGDAAASIRYKRRWSYFLLFTDFVPELWDADGELRDPSELKSVGVADPCDAAVLLATFSSSLFWWYFSVFTDNRNVNRRDLAAFPLPDLDEAIRDELGLLAAELMASLRATAQVRTCTYRSVGTIRNTYFRQGATRPVLDRIDAVLARAYGMSDAQLEFVLGFERRFRS